VVLLTRLYPDDLILRDKIMNALKAPSATALRSLFMKLYYDKDLCLEEEEIYLRVRELVALVDDEDHNWVDNIIIALIRRIPFLKVSDMTS
jgi:hypothetical protein